jgi:ATP-dependent DNA helicase RecG
VDSAAVSTLVERLRRFGGEPSEVEAKAAEDGLPKSVVETLCAFANTNGGTLILGIDERAGFAVVPLADPVRLRDNLVSVASDNLEPPLRLATCLVEFDGQRLVVAEVDPIPSDHRPCYVASKGIGTGSYR